MSNLDLQSRVEALIDEVNTTHRYSMSRIYNLYNEAFGTNESPQSCASCLMRKVKELKLWLDNAKQVNEVMGDDVLPEEKEEEAQPKPVVKKKRRNGSAKA